MAAVTACDHIHWVDSTKLCFVQLTSKHPWGGGFLLGVDFVTEKIANLFSVGSQYHFHFALSAVPMAKYKFFLLK